MPENVPAQRGEPAFFGRNSDIYKGGPAEGALQRIHPAARLIGAVMVLAGVGLAKDPLALVLVFGLSVIVAAASYLNLASLYKLMLLPVVFVALPVWVAAAIFQSSVVSGSLLFIRTLTSLAVAGVAIHSIGLRNIAQVIESLGLPRELKQMWSIMVAQVNSFAGLVADMVLARKARHIGKVSGNRVRMEVGRQAGVLFARTWQRGNQLAYSMDARSVAEERHRTGRRLRFTGVDFLYLIACFVVAAVVAFL